ncbi:P-type ATPase [Aspergillus bombycis]|uniref:P-type ATPase n=1 Tax=Aspergillus bombycis TaxID=109264 RepID=A0A1F8A0W4_9EURO|nr:P-type ATPase [Aspergillus bombycis]OGM45343.1 P-type ATPase [Aspergillus bombycis]
MEMDTSMPLVGRSRAIFTVCVVMMCLSIVAVILRVFVRSYIVRAFGWDDTLMVAAVALFTFLNICCIIGTKNGVGHQLKDFTSLDTLQKAMLWWWLGQMLYIWSSAVAKVSIALALIRLTVRKIHLIILWTVIAVVIAIGLMFWLVLLFDCNPVSYFWERLNPLKSGTCLSTDILLAIAYLYSAITIFCDFTLEYSPSF